MQTVEHPSTFSPRAAYDGNKLLYSIVNLGGSRTFDVNMSDRRPVDPNNKKGVFTVKLTLARIFKPQLLNALLSGQTTDEDEHLAAINFLQVLLRQAPMQNTVRGAHNARSVFTEHHKRDVANFPLELWRGYFQSVRPAVNKMLVNVDMTAAAMYKGERVDFWAISFLHDQNARRLTQMTKDSPDFKRLKAALKNVRVLTKVPDNKRARPIREIICNVGNYDFFDDSINQTTTIKEYFVRRHGYRLQNPNSFGLGFGPGGKIVVPAEVCVIEPGQIYKKVLPPELAPDMLRFSAVLPHERIADIGNAFLSYHESDFVSQVGMRINPLPMEIVGRLLQPPVIQYRDGQAPARNDTRGVWNVVNQKFVESGMPSTWAVVDFSGLDDNTIGRFTQDLIRACGTAGMNVNPSFQIFRGNAHNVPRSLEEASRQPRPDLLLIIVPDSAAPVIKGIKLWGDCTTGMRTQCIKRGKVPRANSQYHNNVALKINVKLGGINSLPGPASPISEALRKMPTMVVGADVGHPGPGIRDRPSITSLVASTDPYMSKYCAYTRIQPPRVEIIERLDHMIYEAMLKFVQINKAPPLRIIFFRDGVSEGEYDTVHKEEIPAIYRAWAKFLEVNKKQGVPLSLTFIVVGKRHHIRFFPAERDPRSVRPPNRHSPFPLPSFSLCFYRLFTRADSTGGSATEKSGNVHGGLVVDRDVSTPTALDFYLQSHSGLKGSTSDSLPAPG
ncbi:ribonuclease H-like domain-containing protein [Amylostereum chailletii]|nr:ribonuclease H-like domain-containing protein [Amylostereum chailletii]